MELLVTGMPAFEILLVEDSPGDVRLTREALKDAKMPLLSGYKSNNINWLPISPKSLSESDV